MKETPQARMFNDLMKARLEIGQRQGFYPEIELREEEEDERGIRCLLRTRRTPTSPIVTVPQTPSREED